jgi:hypothetical protein
MSIIIDHRLPLQHVGMGQLSVGTPGQQLQALLGSCIGIGFLWKNGPCCGLAHCLLPEAPGADGFLGAPNARYVSQAVPSLLRLMGVREADYADIDVVLAPACLVPITARAACRWAGRMRQRRRNTWTSAACTSAFARWADATDASC